MTKRGLSSIIATLLLVVLVVIAVGFIFTFAVPFVRDKLDEVGTCSSAIGKVELNPEFTCHSYEKLEADPKCWEDTDGDGCSEKGWGIKSVDGKVSFVCEEGGMQLQALASVNIKDIEIDSLIFRITGREGTKSYEIKSSSTFDPDKNYDTDPETLEIADYHAPHFGFPETFPGENSGRTYVFIVDSISRYGAGTEYEKCTTPLKVELAPVIDGKVCGFTDSIKLSACTGEH